MPKRTPWTDAEVALLTELYTAAGATARTVAEHLGRTESQVSAKAWALGLRLHDARRLSSGAAALREALRRAGAGSTGFATHEIPGVDTGTVGKHCVAMCGRGELFRAKLSYRSVRFFTDAGAALRYESEHRLPAPAPSVTVLRGPVKAPWPADAPMHITAQTKRTVAPKLPERVLRTNTHSDT